MTSPLTIVPGPRRGKVTAPKSKSHEHRLLIAGFLAGDLSRLAPREGDSEDILATKRCLKALSGDSPSPVLDCGESGSTRRFLSPVAAALGKRPVFRTAGRLAERPQADYGVLNPGSFILDGGVSSQFVTGLLFALPLLDGDSSIRFSTPLESRGYVDMTLRVIAQAGIGITESDGGYDIPGGQKYRPCPGLAVEGDWSGAAFWYVMNTLGGDVEVSGLDENSAQPDKAVRGILRAVEGVRCGGRVEVDVSECPDLFPALCVAAGAMGGEVVFAGTKRLRYKESDRVAAMAGVLRGFGVETEQCGDAFTVHGTRGLFKGCEISTEGDHRVAMAAAVGAACSSGPVTLDDAACAAKSYPAFFGEFMEMEIITL